MTVLFILFSTGLSGLFCAAAVAAAVVRGGFPPHGGAGASQVRSPRLEHPVRVQPGRLRRQCAVRAEPPRRHGPQEGN